MYRPEDNSRLGRAIADEQPVIMELLYYHYKHNSTAFLESDGLEKDPSYLIYVDLLDGLLNSGRTNNESWFAGYSAFHFGHFICGLSGINNEHPDIAGYMARCEALTTEKLKDNILQTTGAYLNDHVAVDELIGTFMPELDPSGRYEHIVETIAALACIHIEDADREQMSKAADIFRSELNDWDGNFN